MPVVMVRQYAERKGLEGYSGTSSHYRFLFVIVNDAMVVEP